MVPILGASLIAAVLAGILTASGCSSPPGGVRCPPGASCPEVLPFRVSFAMTVNGRAASLPRDGSPPRFSVQAGQHLVINVAMAVPRRATVSELWLGISTGALGSGPKGPIGIDPILAHSRQLLTAGRHSFRLRWLVPVGGRSGTRLYLAAVWASRQPPTFSVGQNLASLVPQRAPARAATTAATRATITIGTNPTETFAPAPSSATPALTAYQAWLRFARHVGSHRTSMPPGVTARLGLFTMAAGPAALAGTSRQPKSHGEAYIALNQLAYGYSSHSCPLYLGRMPGMPPPPPTPCIEWLFLNANTGQMVIETWQQ